MRCFNHPAAEAVGLVQTLLQGALRPVREGHRSRHHLQFCLRGGNQGSSRHDRPQPQNVPSGREDALTQCHLVYSARVAIPGFRRHRAPGIHVQLLDRIWSPHASGCRIFGLQQPPNCEAVIPGCPKVTST